MIFFLFVELISVIIGLISYKFYRNRVGLIVNVISAILVLFGLKGAILLKFAFVFFHWIITTGLVISFFVYGLISMFFRRDRGLDDYHVPEMWMLVVYSLPYLVDFIVGTYGCVFFTYHQDLWQDTIEDQESGSGDEYYQLEDHERYL